MVFLQSIIISIFERKRKKYIKFCTKLFSKFVGSVSDPGPFVRIRPGSGSDCFPWVRIRIGQKIRIWPGKSKSMKKRPITVSTRGRTNVYIIFSTLNTILFVSLPQKLIKENHLDPLSLLTSLNLNKSKKRDPKHCL